MSLALKGAWSGVLHKSIHASAATQKKEVWLQVGT
jgi:hypothetical protein